MHAVPATASPSREVSCDMHKTIHHQGAAVPAMFVSSAVLTSTYWHILRIIGQATKQASLTVGRQTSWRQPQLLLEWQRSAHRCRWGTSGRRCTATAGHPVQWLRRPAETACTHMNHCIICYSVPLRTNLADEHGQQLCCACDGQLTTKLDMRAAKCNVAQPCSVTLAPHSTAAQKKATMPSGQHSAQAAMRLLTAVPNGGPSCSTEPAMCTNAVSGRKQTCVAAEGVCFS